VRWQFNQAVSFFGRMVDNKLSERDEKGRPKTTIEELLGLPLENKSSLV
jgi:hypothetical protein